MEIKKQRKTDRRTLYTRNVIKDGLLEALEHKSFEEVTVTEVCRLAEITRATYYLHYQSLTEVLDDLLSDALCMAEDHSPTEEIIETALVLASKNVPTLEHSDALLPVCHRVAQLPKYKVIFRDETISDYVVNKIYQSQKPKLVASLTKTLGLTKKEAELLALFLIHGTYSVNKALNWSKNQTWYEINSMIFKFEAGGFSRLKDH